MLEKLAYFLFAAAAMVISYYLGDMFSLPIALLFGAWLFSVDRADGKRRDDQNYK